MATALSSPFDSTLDAILHYFPLDSNTRTQIHFDTTSTTTSSLDLDLELHQRSTPTSPPTPTPTPSLPPLDLPLPYIYPCSNSNLSPSRFSPSKMKQTQVQHPEPRRPAGPRTINPNPRMDTSPNRLSAPRAARSGSSPSRSPYHGLSALSPLQGISPMQPMSLPKPNSGSSTPTRPASLSRAPSRRQSMVQSAADWKRESGIENRDAGSQTSRLILCKAPKEDEGIFGKVYVY
jgi:hypothetical protein